MEDRKVMLTTIDNKIDPFTDFALWLLRDKELGYNTVEYLARIAKISDDMTQKEEDAEIERAIDEIVAINPLGIYIKKFNPAKQQPDNGSVDA